ncbi:MAG TPA: hypothetical protein PKD37_07860 [Oligoflexia bacterium]|nr:hypothetical protein [Oligoflexia bacterium]HMP27878.1 hypothetical protein [Oligoflexia bacterium]
MDKENKSSWLKICGLSSQQVASQLTSRVKAKIEAKAYTEKDLEYISHLKLNLNLNAFKSEDPKLLERFRALCVGWDVQIIEPQLSSHRKFFGPLIVFVKRALFPIAKALLGRSFSKQREFNAQVLLMLSELTARLNADANQIQRSESFEKIKLSG